MKISLNFLICLSLIIYLGQTQYYGWYLSPQEFLDDELLQSFFNAFNTGTIIPDTSQTLSEGGVINFTNIVGYVSYQPNQWTIISDTPSLTIMGVTGGSHSIQGTLTFNYVDQGVFVGTAGNATADFQSTIFIYNKSVITGEDFPNFTCNFLINYELISFQITNGNKTSTQSNILKVLQQLLLPEFAKTTQNNLYNQCNSFYSSISSDWPTQAQYFNDQTQKMFTYSNNFSLVSFSSTGLIFAIDGTITNFEPVSQIITNNTFQPNLGQIQYVVTSEAIQAWIDLFYENNLYVWIFNSQNFYLKTFDYIILDLANIIPSLIDQYSPFESVNIQASYITSPNNLTLNGSYITVLCNVSINALLTTNQIEIFTSSVLINISIKPRFSNGRLQFYISASNLIPGSIIISGVTLTSTQLQYYEYYLQSGLNSLKNSELIYGSNFEIYGLPLSKPYIEIINGFLYLIE